jgi:hypothetical protein
MRAGVHFCFWSFLASVAVVYAVSTSILRLPGSLNVIFIVWPWLSFVGVFLSCAMVVTAHPQLVRKVLLVTTAVVLALMGMMALP